MNIKRAAQVWSLSERRVNELCKTGRIEGAHKEDGKWVIPANARKPVDERYKVSAPPSLLAPGNRPLPIGITDFKKISDEYFYVDKTLFIKEILDEKAIVSLFTRPRAFGKTLNLDMIRTFFEMTEEDNSVYFRNKKIWLEGEKYRAFMGKFPVIYLDFRSVRFDDWITAYEKISKIIIGEYERHRVLMNSERVSQMDQFYFTKILTGRYSTSELKSSLFMLTKMLHEHYGEEVIVIVDEYDTPVSYAHNFGYETEMREFFSDFYYEGLQENRNLRFAFICGILNLIGEGIFNRVSNIKVNSVLDKRYGDCFGFTDKELDGIIDYFGAEVKEREIKNWYAVYQFGESEVYNPWSIMNYFNDDLRPLPFWEMTGDNEVINIFLDKADLNMLEQLELMMQSKTITLRLDTTSINPDDDEDPNALYSYMIAHGYFKAVKAEMQFDGDYMCQITIPNREVSFMFGKKILIQFEPIIPKATAMSMREAIYRADAEALRSHIYNLIVQTIGFNSADSDRIFYHGLVLGLCSMLGNRYHVVTDGDSETGNFSIEMMPLETRLPGILIQTKRVQMGESGQLEALARFACKQITNRQYDNESKMRYISQALKYGVAYSGTAIKIVME
ncbi:MAG: AAA family ATPase [Lachnospiraceae bacterium]|nr:AAA family ATPase [Lachnospiraceae bacterium]